MRVFLFAVAILAFIPAASFGAQWDDGCDGISGDQNTKLSAGQSGCWTFDNSDAANSRSPAIIITKGTLAVVCFDPDTGGTGVDTSRLAVHHCPFGMPVSNPEYECINVGGSRSNATLDGVEGPVESQNACVRVGPGIFYGRIVVQCASDACRMSVEAE